MQMPQIILLTHEHEDIKPTNTGRLGLALLPEYVEKIMWSRIAPNEVLVTLLQSKRAALVYPSEEAKPLTQSCESFEYFVILDATWQQARKIYSQSSYLKSATKISIDTKGESDYQLRRNQKAGGLCTAECIGEILYAKDLIAEQQALNEAFKQFNIKQS